MVTAAEPLPREVTRVDQVGYDALGRSFRDADVGGDITKPHCGVAGDTEEDVRMVGEESPLFHGLNHTPSSGVVCCLSLLFDNRNQISVCECRDCQRAGVAGERLS